LKKETKKGSRMKNVKSIISCSIALLFIAGCGGSATTSTRTSPDEVKTVMMAQVETIAKPAPAMPGINVPAIKVNTVGYPIGWQKMVVFNVDPKGAVVLNKDGKEVLKVKDSQISEYGFDAASQDPVWHVDITKLDTPGTYTMKVGDFESDPFGIDEYWKLYEKPAQALLKSFYFQRTRTALVEPYAVWEGDKYTREGVSHVHDDVGWDFTYFPEKKQKWQTHPEKKWWPGEQIKKGWHDAGNFDMYVPATALSPHSLLQAYEMAPELFKDKAQNIPESGNGVPDIIDECTWGLDWILSMQQKDGAFRHSEAVKEWTAPISPDKDKEPRWIRDISSSATAKAVAALAQAAQIYKEFPQYADMAKKYEEAAKLGWEWLQKNPDHVILGTVVTPEINERLNDLRSRANEVRAFPNLLQEIIPGTHGSPQPLWDDGIDGRGDKSARFVAAVEMWTRFRDEDALKKIRSMIFEEKLEEVHNTHIITTGAWVNISRYGLMTLALDKKTPEDIRKFSKEIIVKCADEHMLPKAEKDGHNLIHDINEYYWGHNSNLAEKTHMLAIAAKLTGDKKYMKVARDQWHWLMGRNPNSYSMATRIGKGPTAFYHLEWGPYVDKINIDANPPIEPPPGYAVGGPNSGNLPGLAPGAPAKALLWDNPETTRYGTPPGAMWHWKQENIWDGGFVKEGEWNEGWWAVTENNLHYSAAFFLALISIR
jgi:endoglucanase